MAKLRSSHLPRSGDQDDARCRRNVTIIGLGLSLLGMIMIPLAVAQGATAPALVVLTLATATFLGATGLARVGYAEAGATLIIAVCVAANLAGIAFDPATPSLPFFLVLGTLLATVLLPPVYIWAVLLICLLGNALTASLVTPELRDGELWSEAVTNSSLLITAVAVVGYLSASSVRQALAEARKAREETAAAGRALSATNATLEARVEERTAALRQIAEEHRAAAAELAASLQAQQELNRLVAELAVPVIPVRQGTLVVPLVGNIDSARAQQLLALVLTHVEQARAHTVVLDVTGVALVDTHIAAALLRVAQAAQLMGADTILAGIRPEVAQALVGLGVDLRALHTVATLQEAL